MQVDEKNIETSFAGNNKQSKTCAQQEKVLNSQMNLPVY